MLLILGRNDARASRQRGAYRRSGRRVLIRGRATIVGRTDRTPVSEYDLSMYTTPSRYAEVDKFGFAATGSGNYADSATVFVVRRVSRLWIRRPATPSWTSAMPLSRPREDAGAPVLSSQCWYLIGCRGGG